MNIENQQHPLIKKARPLSKAYINKLCLLDGNIHLLPQKKLVVDCYDVAIKSQIMVLH